MRQFSGIFDIDNVIAKIEEKMQLIYEEKILDILTELDTGITQKQVEEWIKIYDDDGVEKKSLDKKFCKAYKKVQDKYRNTLWLDRHHLVEMKEAGASQIVLSHDDFAIYRKVLYNT